MDTVTCRYTETSIDSVKVGMRFPWYEELPVQMINDALELLRAADHCKRLFSKPHKRSGTLPRQYHFLLPGIRLPTLFAETGSVYRKGHYATFKFNHKKVYADRESYHGLVDVMDNIFLGGGYSQLLEDGALYAIEFAIDFIGVHVGDVEAFYPYATPGKRFGESGLPPETFYLDHCGSAENQIRAYNKRLQSRLQVHHHRRDRLRIEAAMKLNKTALKNDHIADLPHRLRNPFRDLVVVERAVLPDLFSSGRDAKFLRDIARHGLQAALGVQDTYDRRRREALIRRFPANWWKPEEHWEECKQRVIEFDVPRY